MPKQAKEAAIAAGILKRRRKVLRRSLLSLGLAAVFLTAVILIDCFVFPLKYIWSLTVQADVSRRKEGELRVHILDAGQGDCTLIEFPDGSTMLIDGGTDELYWERSMLGYCFALGIERFDAVMLTHVHSDHAGGLDEALDCFGADTVYVPYCSDDSVNAVYAEFMQSLEKSGAEAVVSQMYQTILPKEGEYRYFGMLLAPFSPQIDESAYNAAGYPYDSEAANDASAVLYVEYAGRNILFTGDASAKVEERLVEDFIATDGAAFAVEAEMPWGRETIMPRLQQLDFLKAGHHGGSSASSAMLAGYSSPERVFFSCGAGNAYGHPSLDTIAMFEEYSPGVQFYRTDELGTIVLTIRANGEYSIEAQS